MLVKAGCEVKVVDNLMPELGRISVKPAQAAIRTTFMERIVAARRFALALQGV